MAKSIVIVFFNDYDFKEMEIEQRGEASKPKKFENISKTFYSRDTRKA